MVARSLITAFAAAILFPNSVISLSDGRNPTEPCATDRIELIEELRIGQLQGDPRYLFGQIDDLAIDMKGGVVVADLHPQSVRRFARNGSADWSLEAIGQGPGEFRSIAGIEVRPSGEIAVWDAGNHRVSVFSAEGRFVEDFRVASGVYAPEAFVVDRSGEHYVKIHGSPPIFLDNGRVSSLEYAYLRLSTEGVIRDTIALPPENPSGSPLLRTPSGAFRPFPVEPVYSLSRLGYLVIGSNETYSFELRDPRGTVAVTRGYTPLLVTRSERREWETYSAYLEQRSGRMYPEVPAVKPPYRRLWTDDDGRVWAHRYVRAVRMQAEPPTQGDVPAITWLEPTTFDVFSPSGDFLGCVRLPDGARVLASRNYEVWGTVLGNFDEEYVVRWRLGRPPRQHGRVRRIRR